MKKTLISIIIFFAFILGVSADADYSYRATKDNKPYVTINGEKVYITTSVLFNMNGSYSNVRKPINNISASFNSGTLTVYLKRSEINKVLKEDNYENVYSLLEINGDYLDIDSSKKYFYFHQLSPDLEDGKDYAYTNLEADYFGRTYNFLEVFSCAATLVGTGGKMTFSTGGGFILVKSDSYPEDFSASKEYDKDEIIKTGTILIDIDKTRINVQIDEDETIDLGNNTEIIDAGNGVYNEETGQYEHPTIDINNFYGEYFSNNKLKYSWTMYDTEGNPVEIDVNTNIKIDDSENEESIIANFNAEIEEIKDRIKIISFEHDGDLNGKAEINLYVGDKFEPNTYINIYYYNPDTFTLEKMENLEEVEEDELYDTYKVLVDKDGYIKMSLTHCSEYVLAPTDLTLKDTVTIGDISSRKTKSNSYIILITLVLLLIISVILLIIIKKNKKEKQLN